MRGFASESALPCKYVSISEGLYLSIKCRPGLVGISWSGFFRRLHSWSGFWDIPTKVGRDFILRSFQSQKNFIPDHILVTNNTDFILESYSGQSLFDFPLCFTNLRPAT